MLLKYLMYISTVFYYDGSSKVILELIESQDLVGDILIRQKRSIVHKATDRFDNFGYYCRCRILDLWKDKGQIVVFVSL
jgi:hypothetical protein